MASIDDRLYINSSQRYLMCMRQYSQIIST